MFAVVNKTIKCWCETIRGGENQGNTFVRLCLIIKLISKSKHSISIKPLQALESEENAVTTKEVIFQGKKTQCLELRSIHRSSFIIIHEIFCIN